ncbi:hypothetical protein [Caulobacter phage Kronos]|uniref:Uncharacterized protein n=1 Tax=Caulobacter phage Kronos TaxID=2340873 RepID=A0A386KRN0_9CAUD|nr:hypothetical protein [Caulobacter phage Kronos]
MNPRTELLMQRARVAGAVLTGPEADTKTNSTSDVVVYLTTAEGEFSMVFPDANKGDAFAQELANEGRSVEVADQTGGVLVILPNNTPEERAAFMLAERQAAAAQGDTVTAPASHPLAGDGDTPELIVDQTGNPRTADTAEVADAIRIGVKDFAPGSMSADEIRAAHGMGPRSEDHTPAQLLTAFAFAHGAVAVHSPDPSGRPIDPTAPDGTLRVSWMLEPANAKGEHDSMGADFLDVPCAVKFIRALAEHENVGWNSAMLCCDRQHEDAVSAAMEEAYGVKPEKGAQPDPKQLFGEDFKTVAEHIVDSLGKAIRAEKARARKARLLKLVDTAWPIITLLCLLPFVRFVPVPVPLAVVVMVAMTAGTVRMVQRGERWWPLLGAACVAMIASTLLEKLF